MQPAEEAFDTWLHPHLLHAPDPGCLRLYYFAMMEVAGHVPLHYLATAAATRYLLPIQSAPLKSARGLSSLIG